MRAWSGESRSIEAEDLKASLKIGFVQVAKQIREHKKIIVDTFIFNLYNFNFLCLNNIE
jgi:hypothetical protein